MKKCILALVTSMIILGSSVSVMADIPDISGLTDEEIIQLLADVQQAVVDRHIEKTATLAAGDYLVGTDIPAGSYVLYCRYEDPHWATLSIIDVNGEERFYEEIFSHYENPEGTWNITLAEGETLHTTAEATLTVSTGITFE